ncbi:MAG TPA: STAS domain-containing protein [Solirubrobacteraceae bacterium]|nr:STAS domain-containing protein [Solirubrobacteraceae bacterium]
MSGDPAGDHHELVVLVAGGELDFHASPRLRESIAEHIRAGARHIVLDLSSVTFIDSTAIGVLVGAATRLQEAGGGSVAAVCSDENERVLRIFDIAGVDSVITLYSSREQAFSATATVA